MIKINQIKLPVTADQSELKKKIIKKLKLNNSSEFTYRILKRSLDARKKPELFYTYSVAVDIKNESAIVKRCRDSSVLIYQEKHYRIPPSGDMPLKNRPVIVGAGPAGLFCAFVLVEAGYSPVVIERGSRVEKRTQAVARFWETGVLNPSSNVQFGEGGAGTFSDGKLNTSVKDPTGRNTLVLETFVRFGADSSILYDNKPHIGTDVLSDVIVNMRNYLIEKGATFMFDTCVTEIVTENGSLCKLKTSGQEISADVCVLAPGHSSRDTFEMLYKKGVDMECKNFAVGFRVEHPQSMIDQSQYGIQPKLKLPPSPYKVTSNFPNGRGVYSFCMCPGGYVVNSSSQDGHTVVNGMSYHARDSKNANSAIIVSVSPKDYGASDPLAGVRFQEQLEKENYKRGNGLIPQQLFGDFCDNRLTASYGDFASCTKGQTTFAQLNGLMNREMEQSFIAGMEHFGHLIHGFDRKDAILSGMETRTSSPLRITRDKTFMSNISGIYPCGEGAGYAGGITSAAMDGIKVAETIITKYRNN
ncbi:NAD(P)/FAD-dependent oxidoreductase [Agathobacter sp.]